MRATSYFLRLRGQGRRDRLGQPVPSFYFRAQALASRGGEFIELGAAVVVRRSPAGLEQSLAHQAAERGIERSLLDQQRAPGDRPDAQQHSVTVQRAEGNGFENQKIERAGKKLGLVGHVSS